VVTTCFTLVSDYKQLDRLQDRISLTLISIRNFEATEKCQPWHEYISTTIGVGRGREEG